MTDFETLLTGFLKLLIIWLILTPIIGRCGSQKGGGSISVAPLIRFLFSMPGIMMNALKGAMSFFWVKPNDENASWMGYWERKKFLNPRNMGFCLDGVNSISLEQSYKGVAVLAPTGSGKSTCIVVPTLLKLAQKRADVSICLTDPSGEVYLQTSGALEQAGFEVKAIRVGGDPCQSHFYNPLSFATDSSDLKKAGSVILDSSITGTTGEAQFWIDSAKSLIFLLLKILDLNPSFKNLGNLNYLLHSFENGKPLSNLAAQLDELSFREFKSFLHNDDKVMQGVLAQAKASLSALDENLAFITSRDTLELHNIRQRPTAIFLIVPEIETSYFRFFTTLFFMDLFKILMKSDGLPCLVILEEAGNIGRIPGLSSIVSTCRKRKVGIMAVLQSFAQLSALYSQEAETILSNLVTQIYYPGLPLRTTDAIERQLGKRVVEEKVNGRVSKTTIPLLSAAMLRQMEGEILISGKLKPIRLKSIPFYRERPLKKLAQLPPVKINNPASDMKIDFIPL